MASRSARRPCFSALESLSLLVGLVVVVVPLRAFTLPLSLPRLALSNHLLMGTGSNDKVDRSIVDPNLFQDEEDEMLPIARNFVRAKYQRSARDHGREQCNKEDIAELLRTLLPPVTMSELEEEVEKTLAMILLNPPESSSPDRIDEDTFVEAIVANSYWREAGGLVVKELMYFEALHAYYQTGESLLNNDDYGELKDNLTWEGSSVATMNKKEAMFVTAVAASKRGIPIMDDTEYSTLKKDLQSEGSWVVSRGQDALEKLGLDTFLGYLHRALE